MKDERIHRVSNPGPSGLKSSVLPLDEAHRAHRILNTHMGGGGGGREGGG